jgi:branched-chain amino acid aminotransferase
MKSFVWLNGTLVAEDEAQVSLFDRGYLYGDGLFETMRAYGGKVFCLEAHLARLRAGANAIGMKLPLSQRQTEMAIASLLEVNSLSDAYLRLTISRGVGLGPLPEEKLLHTISLIARPLHLPAEGEYAQGWKAILTSSALAPGALQSQLKSLSYIDKVLAKMQAQAAGVQEAVLVNSSGEIAEGATSNLFIVTAGQLITPHISIGILPGITREVVIELATQMELEVTQTRLTPADLFAAKEAFLTNSIIEIMPLVEVAEHKIGNGKVGPVTQKLLEAYRYAADR